MLVAIPIRVSSISNIGSWSLPEPGSLKCNVDVALFDDGRYGFGLCLCDDKGEFMKAKSIWFIGRPYPQEAEALGLLEAVNWL